MSRCRLRSLEGVGVPLEGAGALPWKGQVVERTGRRRAHHADYCAHGSYDEYGRCSHRALHSSVAW